MQDATDRARSASPSPDKLEVESMKAASAKTVQQSKTDTQSAQKPTETQQKKASDKNPKTADPEEMEKHKQQMIAELQQKQVGFV